MRELLLRLGLEGPPRLRDAQAAARRVRRWMPSPSSHPSSRSPIKLGAPRRDRPGSRHRAARRLAPAATAPSPRTRGAWRKSARAPRVSRRRSLSWSSSRRRASAASRAFSGSASASAWRTPPGARTRGVRARRPRPWPPQKRRAASASAAASSRAWRRPLQLLLGVAPSDRALEHRDGAVVADLAPLLNLLLRALGPARRKASWPRRRAVGLATALASRCVDGNSSIVALADVPNLASLRQLLLGVAPPASLATSWPRRRP